MKYTEIKERIMNRVNNFPLGCAFNDEQFERMMEKWGLKAETDCDKIVRIYNGCFVRKADLNAYIEMNRQNDKELAEALADDDTLLEAFEYELANHEYCYNEWQGNYDTLTSLGFKLRKAKEGENKNSESFFNNPRNFNLTDHQMTIYLQAVRNYWEQNQDY